VEGDEDAFTTRVSITGYPVLFLGTGPGPGSTGSQIPGPGTGIGWEPVPVPGTRFPSNKHGISEVRSSEREREREREGLGSVEETRPEVWAEGLAEET